MDYMEFKDNAKKIYNRRYFLELSGKGTYPFKRIIRLSPNISEIFMQKAIIRVKETPYIDKESIFLAIQQIGYIYGITYREDKECWDIRVKSKYFWPIKEGDRLPIYDMHLTAIKEE